MDTAFFVLFGIFVAAFVVLAVAVLTWAIRRDRAGRDAWLRRREGELPPAPGTPPGS
ncbi:MAG TPA: hypothetical protein VND70_09955 [Acidimicrobiales bacterium]|nr:hypothetical protein [Acidimicrobiales bacterium]